MTEQGFVNEIFENIWKDRYQKNNESLLDNFYRVAKFVAKNDDEVNDFYEVMRKGYFFPGGRTMSNAGIGSNLTLNNCFVAPQIKDDLTSIFESVTLGAKTHQRGGGIGYDFSNLRPAGTPTSNDAVASGAMSFMDVFDAQTATILQGNRRGANMGVMNVYAMNIRDFITAKSKDPNRLKHFNLSVMMDDDFITAVRNDDDIFLHFPVYTSDGRIEKDPANWKYSEKVSAKEIWDLITRMAYDNGEPGVFFYDTMNRDNNLWYIENIVCTNPCAEYLAGTVYGESLDSSDFGGACNLGSLMLHKFIRNPFMEDAYLDTDTLRNVIKTAVRMLDNIIDVNNFPSEIYSNYQNAFRTIGLGVTGLADMLVMLNLRYDSKEGRDYVDNLMSMISYCAYYASCELAVEKAPFPFLEPNQYVVSGYMSKNHWGDITNKIMRDGIRNAKILSVAPCGTMSLTFGNNCSSGIEPIFCLEYERKVKFGGQDEDDVKIVKVRDYAYNEWLKVKDEPWCIVNEDMFVTALNMSVDDHIEMLGVIAKHIDMSVSKTINIPTDYSFEDTQNVYMKVHDLGIKGCTIFRPNEIRQGVLLDSNKKPEETVPAKDTELPRGFILDATDEVVGKKRRIVTGCGSLHCVAFFDPITGDLLETYLSKGSTGGCQNFMIGLSRMISLAARAGCGIHAIIDQLNSCGVCPSYAVRKATKHDTSRGSCCPIAVGNALLDMWKEMQSELKDDDDDDDENQEPVHRPIVKVVLDNINMKAVCPECGEPIVFEGGCNVCKSCGWSKCS